MAQPHRVERYGELSDPVQLQVLETEIRALASWITVSGGWAWHFMSPPGHRELKHAHDHKDVDLFVAPADLGPFVALLKGSHGYTRTTTRFDGRADSQDFYRYTRHVPVAGAPVKVILDVFVGDVPAVSARGARVVAPDYLLTLYGRKHSSGECFSVQIAKELLAQGENPVEHPKMGDYSRWLPPR